MSRLGRRKIGKVESKIGVGSTFTVTIPCRIASKDEAQVKRDTTVTVQCHGRIKIRKDAQGTMTIQECYKKMGADYEDVLKRLYSEGMIRKFARMFLELSKAGAVIKGRKCRGSIPCGTHAQGGMPEPWLYQSLSAYL